MTSRFRVNTYCFLPLYVFCGEQLLVAYLRPSKIDGAKPAGAIHYVVGLAKNTRLLRQAEPWRQEAQARFAATSEKQRVFAELDYAAG